MIKRAMRTRLRTRWLLCLVPSLLLLPVGVMKWRVDRRRAWLAEHPPLSRMDRFLRARLSRVASVRISGEDAKWSRLTGLKARQDFKIEGKVLLHKLEETLRSTDHVVPVCSLAGSTREGLIRIDLPVIPSSAIDFDFCYYHHGGKACLAGCDPNGADINVSVQPRFAPRFEALIADLARQAQAPGHHPAVTLVR